MILLDGRLQCRAVRQIKAGGRCEWTERLLRVTQVIGEYSQDIGPGEAIKLLRVTSTPTAIVRVDRSFLSRMNAVLNYVWAPELHYRVSFDKARIKNVIDNIMISRYLRRHFPSSYVWYGKFDQRITRNATVWPFLESLNEGREDSKELRISGMNGEMLRSTNSGLVVLRIAVTDFCVNDRLKITVFHTPSSPQNWQEIAEQTVPAVKRVQRSDMTYFSGFQ